MNVSTIMVRDDASKDMIIHRAIIDYNTVVDPIVISETATITTIEMQKAPDRRHQHIKGSSFVHRNL